MKNTSTISTDSTINNHPSVLTGTVSQFKPDTGFGIVLIPGHPQSYGLSKETGPRIVRTGINAPFFSGERSARFPMNTDQIVVILSQENGKTKVSHWANAADWDKARELIAGRKQTHPARSAEFMKRFADSVLPPERKAPVAMPKQEGKKRWIAIFDTACTA